MPAEITNSELTDLVVQTFTLESGGKIVTPSSLLTDWDAIYLTSIFADIRHDLDERGYLLKSLSSRDVTNDKKVGKTVGSLADAIFADLAVKPIPVAILGAARTLDQRVAGKKVMMDSASAAYLQGYRDAVLKITSHVLRKPSARKKTAGKAAKKPKLRDK
jgi:hypothetical protein